jgi:hypothetical protein
MLMPRPAFLCLAIALAAQAPLPAPQRGMAALMKGRYLEARDIFAAGAFNPDGSVRDRVAREYWQQFTPMLTGEPQLDTLTVRRDEAPDPNWAAQVRDATARPALDEIVRRARDTRIVIINEAHYSPRDRAFAWQVAQALRPLGYSVLALETFANRSAAGSVSAVERLQADSIVRSGTGTYTQDPVFAAFVRQALAIGYRPVAYEITAEQDKVGDVPEREQAQAANLAAHVRASPGAKLLVHVGHGHNSEDTSRYDDGSDGRMMAARLKEMTRIDPLTIDQTKLTDLQPKARTAYPIAAAKGGSRPAILLVGDKPLVLSGGTDLQVVHPVRRYRHGRPTWLASLGGKPVTIPAALLPRTGERLVQAFAADAPADAVPLDQVLVTAGMPIPKLMLPPGVRVRYAVQP